MSRFSLGVAFGVALEAQVRECASSLAHNPKRKTRRVEEENVGKKRSGQNHIWDNNEMREKEKRLWERW